MRTRTRLLISVGAVASAAGLLFLAWRSARDAADRTGCENNLKQIGLALVNYESAYGYFPSATPTGEKLPADKRLSWLTALWSFYEGGPVLVLDPDSPWDEGVNRQLKLRGADKGTGKEFELSLESFRLAVCPARHGVASAERPSLTNYVGITGLDADSPTLPPGHPRAGVFGFDRSTRLQDVKDGASNTMAVAETAWRNGPWIAGGSASVRAVDRTQRPHIGPGRPFGGLHQGGAFLLYVDGSVRFTSLETDARVLEALATMAGGEPSPRPTP